MYFRIPIFNMVRLKLAQTHTKNQMSLVIVLVKSIHTTVIKFETVQE